LLLHQGKGDDAPTGAREGCGIEFEYHVGTCKQISSTPCCESFPLTCSIDPYWLLDVLEDRN
jgi:hypothetical protein